jgi:hypothetical protein
MERDKVWEGPASELVLVLQQLGYGGVEAQSLSQNLRILAPALQSGLGIAVASRRTASSRLIKIWSVTGVT